MSRLGTAANGTKTFVGRPIVGGNGNGLSLDVGTSSGSMAWVNGQTSIIGQHDVDIYVEKHTELTGAVIASNEGNLTLNTESLGYSDIKDHNTSSSLNAGFSTGGNPETGIYHAEYSASDKKQINRATIGEGTIIIRGNPDQGLEGLNRDLQRAQEIAKGKNTSVVVYIDTAFLKEVMPQRAPGRTLAAFSALRVERVENLSGAYVLCPRT